MPNRHCARPKRAAANLAESSARWSKLALNCAMSTLGAVSGLSLGELAARRDARRLALRILREVAEVAREQGVTMEPVAGLRPDLLSRAPGPVGEAAIWVAARRRPRQRSGMITRLEQGRPAGVEDLNALVPRPFNQRLVDLVHELERGVEKPGPHLLARLA